MEKSRANRIRISEFFVSVQGEGPKTGVPTAFMRTSGCNFRCSGWGVETTLPNGEVVTGCDSPHSVFPEIFMRPGGSTFLTPEELFEKTPQFPENICLTGGEPLLQAKALTQWVEMVVRRGQTVEVFTNGSILVPEEEIWTSPSVSYVMDYKPKWSGDGGKFKVENLERLRSGDCVKFVCKNYEDYREATNFIDAHPEFTGTWLIGAVYGEMNPQTLIEWIIDDGRPRVHLNLQTQALISSEDGETFDESERSMSKIV